MCFKGESVLSISPIQPKANNLTDLAPEGRKHVAWGASPRIRKSRQIQPRRGESRLRRKATFAPSGLDSVFAIHPRAGARGYMLSPLWGYRNPSSYFHFAVLAILFCGLCQGEIMPDKTYLDVELVVDFGKDLGQNFGTLFEGRDQDGRLVCGAGFAGVYNTRFRNDRHSLQFFVRPENVDDLATSKRLPRPSTDSGEYIFDLDGRAYAASHIHDRTVRGWNAAAEKWEDDPSFGSERMRSGDGKMRLSGKILQLLDGEFFYDAKKILARPDIGYYHHFYYARGHLVFFHVNRADEGGFTKIYACPWHPDEDTPVNLDRAIVLKVTYTGETPFAFGQLGDQVLTCSNLGGVYRFDGKEWTVVRKSLKGVSYQVYSIVNYYDKLLMAQYPTGHLLEYDGEIIRELKGQPPTLPGVSKSAREAQSTMIYGGDVWVGVWPWAEVWRHVRDEGRWISMGRLFAHPPTTDKVVHPYEQEIHDFNKQHGTKIVFNNWGQRATSMAISGSSLMIGTSAKAPWRREKRFAFIGDKEWREYGTPHLFTLPGNLAATLQWKEGPMTLRFVVSSKQMKIFQDGKKLGEAPIESGLAKRVANANLKWGQGVFGALPGEIKAKTLK